MEHNHANTIITTHVGERFRRLRRSEMLAQTSIAKHLGLSQGTISRIERGLAPLETAWEALEQFIRSITAESRTDGGPDRVGRLISV